MMNFETIISLPTMTFMVEIGLYELHPINERIFNDFLKGYEFSILLTKVASLSIWLIFGVCYSKFHE